MLRRFSSASVLRTVGSSRAWLWGVHVTAWPGAEFGRRPEPGPVEQHAAVVVGRTGGAGREPGTGDHGVVEARAEPGAVDQCLPHHHAHERETGSLDV